MNNFPEHKVFFVLAKGCDNHILPEAVTVYRHYEPEDIFCKVVNELQRQLDGSGDGIHARYLLVDGVKIDAEDVDYGTFADSSYHIVSTH